MTKLDNIKEDVESLKNSHVEIIEDLKAFKSRYLNLERKTIAHGKEIFFIETRLQLLDINNSAKNIILYNIQYSSIERKNLLKSVKLVFKKAFINIPDEYIDLIFTLGKKWF